MKKIIRFWWLDQKKHWSPFSFLAHCVVKNKFDKSYKVGLGSFIFGCAGKHYWQFLEASEKMLHKCDVTAKVSYYHLCTFFCCNANLWSNLYFYILFITNLNRKQKAKHNKLISFQKEIILTTSINLKVFFLHDVKL